MSVVDRLPEIKAQLEAEKLAGEAATLWKNKARELADLAKGSVVGKAFEELAQHLTEKEESYALDLMENLTAHPPNFRIPIRPTFESGVVGVPDSGTDPSYRWILVWEPQHYNTGSWGSDRCIAAELNTEGKILLRGRERREVSLDTSPEDIEYSVGRVFLEPGRTNPASRKIQLLNRGAKHRKQMLSYHNSLLAEPQLFADKF